jgi:hypothetical protein
MKTLLRSLPLMLGAACLVAGPAALGDARTAAYDDDSLGMNIHVLEGHHHTGVRMDGDDVVITAHDHSKARITPAGDLYIEDKAVAVSVDQRKLLRRYNSGVHNIETRGMQIGRDAVRMVGGIMGVVMADLFSNGFDDDDHKIDADAERAAEPLKQEARALCKDVQAERKVQAAIAAGIPAFQPYAVIDTQSDHDCHVDDDDIEV